MGSSANLFPYIDTAIAFIGVLALVVLAAWLVSACLPRPGAGGGSDVGP